MGRTILRARYDLSTHRIVLNNPSSSLSTKQKTPPSPLKHVHIDQIVCCESMPDTAVAS